MHPNSAPTGPESTRQALIEAGLHLFGAKGYAATSTREIAQAARANIASIAYHFGSKEGLRRAIADSVASTMRGAIDQAFGDRMVLPEGDPLARRHAAKAALAAAIDRMAQFLFASPMGAMIPRFVLREMTELSPSFDALYEGVFEPAHKRLCRLFGEATGADPEAEDTRLAVFAMIGPLLYFRIGAPAVQRRMGWSGYGPDEAARIARAVTRLVTARLDPEDVTR